MRINQFIALSTGLSRREADKLIETGQITVGGVTAKLGMDIAPDTSVIFKDNQLKLPATQTILLNKPAGYVCSRDGQGSKTIYDLLPTELHGLKPVGRLDKDSSGLLLLTNDGNLAQLLTHPSNQKEKTYEVELDKELSGEDSSKIEHGVELEDGISKLRMQGAGKKWIVTMHEGRNRQIRRTFEAIGYTVTKLHRTNFGTYSLDTLESGKYKISA
jgi:23S rRNA pseudouridine2605 synthase